MIGGEAARMAQTGFVFAAMLGALMLGPSAKFRAWFRVKVSKHLFQHRYDYRSEWLRFTNTLGRPDDEAAALNVRVVQAVADILESSSGLLLTPDTHGALLPQANWNWSLPDAPPIAGPAALSRYLTDTGRVVECDSVRDGISAGRFGEESDIVPEWILAEPQIWALVPLVHFDRLAGVVVLTRPILSRTLDWEDFDLLRVVGRQVASYLAEARSQDLLSEARRFDEFNRRFAFIMHDIKNLVSQLSLVTRNAERHADNPAFRADMIETLKSSTARMNALLARLSQHNKGKREEPVNILIADCARRVADNKRAQHPVLVTGDFAMHGVADPARLEQALGHLVQNAIDATDNGEPITIALSSKGGFAQIDVIDLGAGMSAAFIDAQLFKPFMSTKEAGFGIGTYEARSDIIEMGGRLQVNSREGAGTTFSITLPLTTAAIPSLYPVRELAA
jgi:putative PEP-CTERM system histidine kinase